MTRCQVVRLADVAPTTWRNGTGTTRELLSEPAAGDADFAWRVSIAEVTADGPFSSFPGVDRHLVLCEGSGMSVTVDGATRVLRRFDTLAFPGEATTSARLLEGPTRDLNIMTARGSARSTLTLHEVHGSMDVVVRATTVLVVLEGELLLQPWREQLGPLDAARLDGSATVGLHGRGRVAVVVVPAAPGS